MGVRARNRWPPGACRSPRLVFRRFLDECQGRELGRASAASLRRGQPGIVRLVCCLVRLASRFSLSVLPGFLPAGRCGDLSGMVVPLGLSTTW